MANPRITARVSEPVGDQAFLRLMTDGSALTITLPDASAVAAGREMAAIITILAGLEAADRTYRESRMGDFDGADVIAVETSQLRALAAEIEAHRNALEAKYGRAA